MKNPAPVASPDKPSTRSRSVERIVSLLLIAGVIFVSPYVANALGLNPEFSSGEGVFLITYGVVLGVLGESLFQKAKQ